MHVHYNRITHGKCSYKQYNTYYRESIKNPFDASILHNAILIIVHYLCMYVCMYVRRMLVRLCKVPFDSTY